MHRSTPSPLVLNCPSGDAWNGKNPLKGDSFPSVEAPPTRLETPGIFSIVPSVPGVLI